jgi:hypothetical protein
MIFESHTVMKTRNCQREREAEMETAMREGWGGGDEDRRGRRGIGQDWGVLYWTVFASLSQDVLDRG